MRSALSGLRCGLPVRIEYDSATRTGTIHMRPHGCTDMPGAIRLFTAIDPEVRTIATFAGERPDTSYRRIDGAWRAFEMRHVEASGDACGASVSSQKRKPQA
jgi:hypothetical protein